MNAVVCCFWKMNLVRIEWMINKAAIKFSEWMRNELNELLEWRHEKKSSEAGNRREIDKPKWIEMKLNN